MAWYNFWKKKKVLVEELVAPVVTPPALDPVDLTPLNVYKSDWRNGMWVVTPKGVGVMFQLGYPAIIHLVDEKGETIGEVREQIVNLRQAAFSEIPKARTVGLTPERARQLGYM